MDMRFALVLDIHSVSRASTRYKRLSGNNMTNHNCTNCGHHNPFEKWRFIDTPERIAVLCEACQEHDCHASTEDGCAECEMFREKGYGLCPEHQAMKDEAAYDEYKESHK